MIARKATACSTPRRARSSRLWPTWHIATVDWENLYSNVL